jgi:D-sedoheptulose 7-phosphate isomerase
MNQTAGDVTAVFNEVSRLAAACAATHAGVIEAIARELIACFELGGKLLLCGNGGSASQAQHLAAEFVNKLYVYRRPLAALALTTDSSALTSIGNDLSFSAVFARQVEALGAAGDVLWGLSTSGASPNVLAACAAARSRGMRVVCFAGRPGSPLGQDADICLTVPSDNTARIQEIHLLCGHCVCEVVENHYRAAGCPD